MNRQKKVMAVHDISCVGKCSLTVILPILTAAGIETAPLPTSLLSTHTGGFQGYTFHDLTDEMRAITKHWKSFGLTFDAIYTGYLGSIRQTGVIEKVFHEFGDGILKVVDPVMADGGTLYAGLSQDLPSRMLDLCKSADLILPNMTEAAILLGEPYREGPYEKEYIVDLLYRLSDLCAGKVVLTGVYFNDERIGAATYDPALEMVTFALTPWVDGAFHGTGDVFGSALLAALLLGRPLREAATIAANFTYDSICLTAHNREPRYGLSFELALPGLMKALHIL